MRRLLILLLLGAPLWAQPISLNHLKTNTDNFPELVQTSLLALGNSGEPLQNLSGANFQVRFGGSEVDTLLNVATFEDSRQGLSILICVDASGSMRGQPLNSVKNALLSFIGEKRNNDEIAILAFAEQPELVCDFTTDTEFLRKSVANLKILPGDTSLYYSLDKGLDRLSGPGAKNEGRFLILFSDGREDNPAQAYTIDKVIEKARGKQIPIFTAGYSTQQKQYLQYLERIAQETGGSYYNAPDPPSLSGHFGKVRRQILGSYTISYPVFEVAGDGLAKDLSVILSQDGYQAEFAAPIQVRVPANKAPLPRPAEGKDYQAGSGKISLGWILGILAIVLAAGAGLFFWLNGKKKKRLAEQRRQEEEELARQERVRLEAERQRAEEERLRLEKARRESETRGQKPRSREHTIILNPGSGTGESRAGSGRGLSLEVLMGTEQGQVFKLSAEGATLGRARENSIVFNDPTVSSRHARIYWSDGQFYIEDLGSLNGVFINGQKVTLSRIENGSTFKLGSNEGVFRLL
ncbi:MAG: VWA domain-containing protein [Candidatus Cloacimonetes bacterium]|nr:VWA domain-containing protein [Candidatus Cloacimonadota bacterium]